ncbi:PREDICTED: vomeronasal type-1 receptor 4-like [Chinchilla lanigera]|uniref:vomeronasal type-1 receptor 4-like n=1 Tax=Chinchilla lanigera TaxID=34839 RepID=UPI00038EAD27|nr:PREDICTED: vomeronasal type-1 receptor 4-like [Chinchilla lanigera]
MVLNMIKITIFILLTGLGMVGNIFVFVNYMCVSCMDPGKKPIRLILIHLTITNVIMLFSKGMPKTVAEFGLENFLNDTGCKIVACLERVARGLSICTSSLLTVVQAITLSPRHSRWRRLKLKNPWHILLFFLFFWILNLLISINLIRSILSRSKNTSQSSKSDKYCYFLLKIRGENWLFLIFMALRDTMFLVVMGGASVYMVLLLHTHHQRVLHLQNKFLRKAPPEIRAAQSVLLLMLSFLFFYWTDCAISLYVTLSLEKDFLAVSVREFLTLGYTIVSPFVLIHRDGHLAEYWHA